MKDYNEIWIYLFKKYRETIPYCSCITDDFCGLCSNFYVCASSIIETLDRDLGERKRLYKEIQERLKNETH